MEMNKKEAIAASKKSHNEKIIRQATLIWQIKIIEKMSKAESGLRR